MLDVKGFSKNDTDYLYVLGKNSIMRLNLTENKIENEFSFENNQKPLKFLLNDDQIYLISEQKFQAFDCQKNEKIFELPLEKLKDLALYKNQISLLLQVENQTAIVKLDTNFAKNIEVFVLNNVFSQIFYARSSEKKQQLIGVDSQMNFVILEESFSAESDLEIEQEEIENPEN